MITQRVTPVAERPLGHRAFHVRTSSAGHVAAATRNGTVSVVGPHRAVVGSFHLRAVVEAISLTPDGSTLAVTGQDAVRLLDLRGNTLGRIDGPALDAWFDAAARLWVAKREGTSGDVALEVYERPGNNEEPIRGTVGDRFGESAFLFPTSPGDGPVPAWIAAGQDGQAVAWLEVRDGDLAVDMLDDFEECCPPAVSPALDEFLLPANSTELRRYDLLSLEQTGQLDVPAEQEEALVTDAIYPDSTDALICLENGLVYRVDLRSMAVTSEVIVLGHEPRKTSELYPGLEDEDLCSDIIRLLTPGNDTLVSVHTVLPDPEARQDGVSCGGGASVLPNEEMQQTKPAFLLDFAGFAADLQCSADSSGSS